MVEIKNVFVLSTGRCGSMTFARACSHISNFTAGHETNFGISGRARLNYPKMHIESDNRLAWMLGALSIKYGSSAFYVHLIRDRAQVAESYNLRWQIPGGIMPAYAKNMLGNDQRGINLCEDYYDTVNANIALFLNRHSNSMRFSIANAEKDFRTFLLRIGARANFADAIQTWGIRFNATQ